MLHFSSCGISPQKSHKIAHFQVSENEEKWLLPVGQSDKLKFSTNHLLKVDFCDFYWFPHLTWNGGIFSTSWKWIFVYFFIVSPSGGRFSNIEALNQLDLEMNCLCFSNAFSYSSEEYSQFLSFLLLLLWPNRKIEIINKPVSILKIFGLKILQRQRMSVCSRSYFWKNLGNIPTGQTVQKKLIFIFCILLKLY